MRVETLDVALTVDPLFVAVVTRLQAGSKQTLAYAPIQLPNVWSKFGGNFSNRLPTHFYKSENKLMCGRRVISKFSPRSFILSHPTGLHYVHVARTVDSCSTDQLSPAAMRSAEILSVDSEFYHTRYNHYY